MLHRHVSVMEYIENNITVLVTVYGINQERRHFKKDLVNITIFCEKTGLITKTCPCNIQQYLMVIKTEIWD